MRRRAGALRARSGVRGRRRRRGGRDDRAPVAGDHDDSTAATTAASAPRRPTAAASEPTADAATRRRADRVAVATADRGGARGRPAGLRPARHPPLPPAVPEQLPHRRRRRVDTGRRVRLPAAGAPANAQACRRRHRVEPQRRLQPEHVDPHLRRRSRPEASNLPPWTDLDASLDDDAHRRARRHRRPANGCRCGPSSTPRPTTTRPRPRDPPGRRAAPRATPTPSACATSSTTAGAPDRAVRRVPRLPRPADHRPRRHRGSPARRWRRPSRRSRAPASSATTSCSRGTSPSPSTPQHHRADAAHPRRRTLGALGDSAPAFTDHLGHDDPSTPRRTDRGRRPQITGTFTRAQLPHRRRLARQRASSTSPTRRPIPTRCRSQNGDAAGAVRLQHPRRGDGRDRAGQLAQYGHGLLGSETEIDAGNIARLRQRAQHRVLRHEVGRA